MFDIEMEFVRGMLFVRLDGILSKKTSKDLNLVLNRMINEQGIRYFVINLENVNQIDEDGIKSLIDRYFDVSMHNGKLVVCGYNHNLESQICDEVNIAFKNIENSNDELGAFHLINI